MWFVYVIQGTSPNGKRPFYVGCTTDVARRIRQHNGELVGGGRYTSRFTDWQLRAVYGGYANRSEAQKAEYALKRGKRGEARTRWTTADHPLCRVLSLPIP